jgi:hypothetical protein
MSDLVAAIKPLLKDVVLFCQHASGLTLREYQQSPAVAITDSVIHEKGMSFVVIFPRQSGKNELQAQLECYLLAMLSQYDTEIVKVSPSWKPQSLNAMRRLDRVISRNVVMRGLIWKKEQGYIYRVGKARIYFMSGAPTANVVGHTASTLLVCDEAQDVGITKWDKEFNPMAASTNATRVFFGTAWTSKTLLAREKRAALKAQNEDGIQRLFELTADDVALEVQPYRDFIESEIAKLGRKHPFVRTQFFSEEIDAESGMFPDRRIALMKGEHHSQETPAPGEIYAFTVDVAGEDEAASQEIEELINPGRDSTSLTIFSVDPASLEDPLIEAPTYRAVNRFVWTGEKHAVVYAAIRSLIESWQPFRIIVDATGVGEPLASFLGEFATGVIAFKFTGKSKSDLGWAFLAYVETGRYKEHRDHTALQTEFYNQCVNAQMTIMEGPNRLMRWNVPDGTRDVETGDLVHDDLLISAALVTLLDNQPIGVAASDLIAPLDPLAGLEF